MDDIIQTPSDVIQKPLKARHQLFVDNYILTKNQSEAARRSGYSVKSASVAGSKLMAKPAIREAIERLEKGQLEASKAQVIEAVERDITKESFITMIRNAYDEVGSKHSNAPRFAEILAKTKGFFIEQMTNNFLVYNSNDPEVRSSVDAKLAHFARQQARISPTIKPEDKSSK